MMNKDPKIITIDGPAGSGKGTISFKLAKTLGWHVLDSGMLYRAVALSYMWYLQGKSLNGSEKNNKDNNKRIAADIDLKLLNYESIIANLALNMQFIIEDFEFYLKNSNDNIFYKVTTELRSEFCGNLASKLAVIPKVRKCLLSKHYDFVKIPGLVADGRDLGTVVFPNANLKIFLDADPNIRALRRDLQLKEFRVDGNLYMSIDNLKERDLRDQERELSPLKPAKDAIIIDTTNMTIDEVFNIIMKQVNLIILR